MIQLDLIRIGLDWIDGIGHLPLARCFPRFYASPPSPLEFGAFLVKMNPINPINPIPSIQYNQSHPINPTNPTDQSNPINPINQSNPIQFNQSNQSNQSNPIPPNPTNPFQSIQSNPIQLNQCNPIQYKSNPIEAIQSDPIQSNPIQANPIQSNQKTPQTRARRGVTHRIVENAERATPIIQRTPQMFETHLCFT